ncbi:MAG: hypothetical protein K9L66_09140 [Spirochaetaceae bacterium]|nr:hypothetical protein [Spirochaetaceae bacterium]MCF7949877.1 hypothetical protein [Spirochaetia bacterium]MCF7951680.1 hypothetical protein [Spirochaetaceae bacterium]
MATLEPQDRVGISMFVRVFSGTTAGLSGSVVGGPILTILNQMEMS